MNEDVFCNLCIGVILFFAIEMTNDMLELHLFTKTKKFIKNIKNLRTMKTKPLLKALRFACLPTLSVLILLFFAFFSVEKTLAFISSGSGFAMTLRVILFIAEISLIMWMYEGYVKEEILEAGGANRKNGIFVGTPNSAYIYQYLKGFESGDKIKLYSTEDEKIIVIERIPQ